MNIPPSQFTPQPASSQPPSNPLHQLLQRFNINIQNTLIAHATTTQEELDKIKKTLEKINDSRINKKKLRPLLQQLGITQSDEDLEFNIEELDHETWVSIKENFNKLKE